MRLLAFTDDATATIVVGVLGVVGISIGAYFSYKAATRVKTSNGHSAGELIELFATHLNLLHEDVKEVKQDVKDAQSEMAVAKEDIASMRIRMDEHSRLHEDAR